MGAQQLLNFNNAPNTTLTNTSFNLIVWTNGSTQSKSLYQKNIRHAPILKAFLTSHKKGDEKHIQIFDNDLDRSSSGSQTLQFNKGLPSDQHNALQKEGVEYLLI